MSVTVRFSCGGCDATAEGTNRLRLACGSMRGTIMPANTVEDVTPEGWVAFDPYTGACYCPRCWAQILCEHKSGAVESDGFVTCPTCDPKGELKS